VCADAVGLTCLSSVEQCRGMGRARPALMRALAVVAVAGIGIRGRPLVCERAAWMKDLLLPGHTGTGRGGARGAGWCVA
jgi:hypothetical protein